MLSHGPLSPFRAHLLVEGERHGVLECSVAGISLARSACHSLALGAMGRGDERSATLVLSGPGGEEAHDVVVRLAGRGPAHVEFAFVMLPASVRSLLEQIGPIRSTGRDAPYKGGVDEPEPPLPRRLILHLSEAVAEITRRRRLPTAPPDTPSFTPFYTAEPDEPSASIGKVLLVVIGLMALAALAGIILFR